MPTDLHLLEKVRHLLLDLILGILQPNSSSWAGMGISMVGRGGEVGVRFTSGVLLALFTNPLGHRRWISSAPH